MKLNRRKNRKLLKVIRDIDLWRAGLQSSGMYLESTPFVRSKV